MAIFCFVYLFRNSLHFSRMNWYEQRVVHHVLTPRDVTSERQETSSMLWPKPLLDGMGVGMCVSGERERSVGTVCLPTFHWV